LKVKICGITDIETGKKAVEYGADAVGFVFAESKRKVPAELAKEIISYLPKDVWKVGVFVNETKEAIERIAEVAGLTHLQLHGDESAAFAVSLSLPVIKAISFQDNKTLEVFHQFPCDYLLLDGPKGKYRGGNGSAFNWQEVNIDLLNRKHVILAGGLDPENVATAINIIKPYMVDVSSGVETEGRKDFRKIKQFIEKAKGII